jgi:hypothetical protein
MEQEQILGVLKGKTGDEIIEVAVQTEADGDENIQFRYREWANGIGWYTQKTVEIGGDQLQRLIGILEKANRRQQRTVRAESSSVLPFAKRYGT